MKRLLSGAAGAVLLFVPSLMLYNVTVPLVQYRTGTYADYRALVVACLTVYGGIAIGILVQWRRRARKRQTIDGVTVFRAGFAGAIVAVIVALSVASVDKGPGNLWGLVIILGGVFGAIVSVGAGLVWYALRGPTPLTQA
jgi:hypothetical protein